MHWDSPIPNDVVSIEGSLCDGFTIGQGFAAGAVGDLCSPWQSLRRVYHWTGLRCGCCRAAVQSMGRTNAGTEPGPRTNHATSQFLPHFICSFVKWIWIVSFVVFLFEFYIYMYIYIYLKCYLSRLRIRWPATSYSRPTFGRRQSWGDEFGGHADGLSSEGGGDARVLVLEHRAGVMCTLVQEETAFLFVLRYWRGTAWYPCISIIGELVSLTSILGVLVSLYLYPRRTGTGIVSPPTVALNVAVGYLFITLSVIDVVFSAYERSDTKVQVSCSF